MPGPWTKLRAAQHRARYPLAKAGERNRLAQLRYRERHAKRRADVRKVTNILMRQTRDAGDIYRLGGSCGHERKNAQAA